MSDNTEISWTDATWNVLVGCDKVSPGCDHCYAIRTAHRMAANPNPKVSTAYAGTEADGEWTGKINLLPERLDQPLRWGKPRRVFVNAQSDLFHADVPNDFIAQVWAVMALAPKHTFQILTKRPGRMRSLLSSEAFRVRVMDQAHLMVNGETPVKVPAGIRAGFRVQQQAAMDSQSDVLTAIPFPLPNVWLGVSVEDQKWADVRVPVLLDTPAAARFLSMEPLLGPVDLSSWLWEGVQYRTDYGTGVEYDRAPSQAIAWVIVGGESGPGARPMHPDWARSLRDQCADAGVAYHFKQWGEWGPGHRNGLLSARRFEYESVRFAPDGTSYRADQPDLYSYPGMVSLLRIGKRKAGRVLDGRTWDEFPT